MPEADPYQDIVRFSNERDAAQKELGEAKNSIARLEGVQAAHESLKLEHERLKRKLHEEREAAKECSREADKAFSEYSRADEQRNEAVKELHSLQERIEHAEAQMAASSDAENTAVEKLEDAQEAISQLHRQRDSAVEMLGG